MTDYAELRFPRPFSLNRAFVNARRGGRVKSPDYKAWREHACMMIMSQGVRPRFDEPVVVKITFPVLPDTSPGIDGDNCIKPILDVLVEMGILKDDNRLCVRGGFWIWDEEATETIVAIETVTSLEEDGVL
jgi:Holliday junction resolvase RusA-like endonuclease